MNSKAQNFNTIPSLTKTPNSNGHPNHSSPSSTSSASSPIRTEASRPRTTPQSSPQSSAPSTTLGALGKDSITTGGSLSATWRLLWTTEKEQLFIIQNASLFGTRTGDVLQVIDVGKRVLNNVITFPPDGVFFVRSDIAVASKQRVNFKFTSAVLRGKNWEIPLPPFGQGW
ncbi:putative plastid-lipid-associated protein 11 [Prunus yedoensis var. nudiflora]|uniref:Putative plastid-lipid-associated protein 11 n=1 Tax=Prunus yedoensis var. nudiflora TaxID=2094558 RepID=A0A314UEA6_PRUYE|nr:putative plastid-lipid-associated protein 11 [Prunus yedoensis var. nudiflora]